ncbi:MAG: GAF domain-containing sensor histidine kinase [Candidatus Xenobia bacterium]
MTTPLRGMNPEELVRFAALATISQLLNASYEVEDVLPRVMDIVIDMLGAQRGFLMLDRGGEAPYIPVARGLTDQFNYSSTIVQGVLETGEPLLTFDATTDTRLTGSKSVQSLQMRSIMCVSMRTRQHSLGCIYLDNRTTTGVFTPNDLQVLKIIADLTAAAIERSQYFASVVQSEKLAALGTVVAGIAHELNNPLSAIMGFNQLLSKFSEDSEFNEMLDSSQEAATRCRDLVRDLLRIARQEKPTMRQVEVGALARQTLRVIQSEFRQEEVELLVDVSPTVPTIMANPDQLLQVLLNLLTNARNAVRGREDARVMLRVYPRGANLILQVIDNGPGIPPENLRKIFDPFFTSRQGEGNGLGLSIVQRIITDHGGTIKAHNDKKGGAVFTVELPLPAPPQPEAAPGSLEPKRLQTSGLAREAAPAPLGPPPLPPEGKKQKRRTEAR